jgi:shikimate dehydrogenase
MSGDEVAARQAVRTDTEESCLVGLVGRGILRSRSPAMHQLEADAQGIRCIYKLIDLNELGLDVTQLSRVLDSAELMGFSGLNITHPCKQAVIPLLTSLSEEARAIGAVNTVLFDGGRRTGFNTDACGFAESFRRGLPGVACGHVVQIGAGGAGAATAYALLKSGVGELSIYDADGGRTSALALSLAERFGGGRVHAAPDLGEALARADGLVHATPMGTREHPGMALPAGLLRPQLWVCEIVYFPLETELLQAARAIGCRTLDGGGMAVYQAAAAFEIFTGHRADGERMLRRFGTITGD